MEEMVYTEVETSKTSTIIGSINHATTVEGSGIYLLTVGLHAALHMH